MTPAQTIYIREAYQEWEKILRTCDKCGPARGPVKKRVEDAIYSIAAYIDAIAVPMGYAPIRVGQNPLCDVLSWGHTWEGGVFEGDSFDTGVVKWYWRVEKDEKEQWASTPIEALLAFVAELEKRIGADPSAPALVYTVRLSDKTCVGEDHDWEFLYEGRHGSDKGDRFYRCRVCKLDKRD